MIIFVYFFKSEHLLSYGVLALLLILIINSGVFTNQIVSIFFLSHHRNEFIKDTDIKSQIFVDEEITKTKLKEEKDKVNEKSNLYNIRKRGLLGTYNQLKQKTAKTLDKLEYAVDAYEKFKNLLAWNDELMTKYFFVFLIVVYFFVTFMPLRYITIIYLIRRFHKGKSYYKRRKRSNELVAKIELAKFLGTTLEKLPNIKEWPKKSKGFETKLINHFQTNLKIYLPGKVIETIKSPQELADYISDVDAVLKLIENDENDMYIEMDVSRTIIRVRKPAYMYLMNFLMNYIPSDFYKENIQEKNLKEI